MNSTSNYPAETERIVEALRAVGLNSDPGGTGGGCMAILAGLPRHANDPLAPYAMVTDGDAALPDGTFGVLACVYTFEHLDFAEPVATLLETAEDHGPLTPTELDRLAADIVTALEGASAKHDKRA